MHRLSGGEVGRKMYIGISGMGVWAIGVWGERRCMGAPSREKVPFSDCVKLLKLKGEYWHALGSSVKSFLRGTHGAPRQQWAVWGQGIPSRPSNTREPCIEG